MGIDEVGIDKVGIDKVGITPKFKGNNSESLHPPKIISGTFRS